MRSMPGVGALLLVSFALAPFDTSATPLRIALCVGQLPRAAPDFDDMHWPWSSRELFANEPGA